MQDSLPSDLSFSPQLRPYYEPDLDAYADTLGGLLIPAGIKALSPEPRFHIQACKLRSGGVVVLVDANPYVAQFHPKELADPAQAEFLATFARRGSGVITQNGVALPFSEGDIIFRTTALPAEALILSDLQVVVIKAALPRLLGAHALQQRRFTAKLAPAHLPLVEMAQRLLTHVFFDPQQSSTAATYFAEEALISLLASIYAHNLVEDTAEGERPHVDAWVAINAFITSKLADPDLSVDTLVDSLRISKSWIHQLFRRHGVSYSDYVRERRLQLAHSALQQPQSQGLPIKQIATQCGFLSASHFSRSFLQRFGESPTDFRDRHASHRP
ncbi:AraC family transcriptional regulator [Comamonas sp. J-3]|uniref:AraC family transcriptional regulator n=1 Tax=Comamonas trifloxystrobinivorans TaxID=3350256 RepID=UPI00372BD3E8